MKKGRPRFTARLHHRGQSAVHGERMLQATKSRLTSIMIVECTVAMSIISKEVSLVAFHPTLGLGGTRLQRPAATAICNTIVLGLELLTGSGVNIETLTVAK